MNNNIRKILDFDAYFLGHIQDGRQIFGIDQVTGNITVLMELDRATQSEYTIKIQVDRLVIFLTLY